MERFRQRVARLMIYNLLFLCLPLPQQCLARPKPPAGPAVKIVAPSNGYSAQVGEKLQIMVVTKPGLEVTSVTVVGSDGAGIGMTSAKPYQVTWDTSAAQRGQHMIKAQIYLADGRSLESSPIIVNIQGPAGVTVKDGTPILLATREKLVSGETPTGAVVLYKVERDVLGPDGQILIPAGAQAQGKVLKSEGSGFFGRSGALDITLESVEGADGTSIPLRSVRAATGNDSEDMVIAGAILLSVFFVFMQGDDVEIQPGTLVTGYVNRDTVVARPQPSKLSRAELTSRKLVAVTNPAPGVTVRKEDKLVFSCNVQPADDAGYVRLYLDNTLVATQKGNFSHIEWDTRKYEKATGNGPHTLFAEVTFSNGQIVMSPPVSFNIQD